ncbi:hypothetical protein LTR97_011202 [Elasticomyces elasticus]|uniref:Uncharacterized protein n=1 Tax=Elasticomyces elasticus TaxID=574655 RepID=A0AAN7VN07_9PEZI|nr:hypothetical protein LTR97_011202 [Elasticomyces elasticus]
MNGGPPAVNGHPLQVDGVPAPINVAPNAAQELYERTRLIKCLTDWFEESHFADLDNARTDFSLALANEAGWQSQHMDRDVLAQAVCHAYRHIRVLQEHIDVLRSRCVDGVRGVLPFQFIRTGMHEVLGVTPIEDPMRLETADRVYLECVLVQLAVSKVFLEELKAKFEEEPRS